MRGPGHRRFQAIGLIGGGLATAATITLYATGRPREAAAIAVTASLIAAAVGVAKVLGGEYETTVSDDPRPGM